MSELASIQTWLTAPMKHDVSEAIEHLPHAPDVQQIAVMPDVHLATDVCIGVVVATSRLIYPQAVGGDIGCGMLAVAFDVEATALLDPYLAHYNEHCSPFVGTATGDVILDKVSRFCERTSGTRH